MTVNDAVERLERGISSYRKLKRHRRNRVVDTGRGNTGSPGGRYTEEDVPDEALDLRREKPDFRASNEYDVITPADRSYEDLSDLIVQAADEGAIVDLGSGTYEMERGVSTGYGDYMRHVSNPDIVGVIGDGATIEYVGTYLDRLFNIHRVPVGVLEDVTFDITGTTSSGHDTDVGVITGNFTDEFWAKDVTLRGERNRFQDFGNGRKAGRVGNLYTWRIQMLDPDATAYVENLNLPDGEVNHHDIARPEQGEFRGSIPVCTDGPHDGLIVYKDCHVEGFCDNGFYTAYSPQKSRGGKAVLWDCYAANVRGGCMRPGPNDTIVGGKTEMHDPPTGRRGKGLDVDQGFNTTVIGLTIHGTDFGWIWDDGERKGTNSIQVRSNTESLELDRVVLHVEDEISGTVRLSSTSSNSDEITVKDCYWYDEASGRSNPAVVIYGIDIDATDWHVRSEDHTEVQVKHSAVLKTDIRDVGSGTYTASDLGMEDPRSFEGYDF